MLPVATASSIPAPTALRPASEIKVRKRRENRSSASSINGAQSRICSETESSSLSLTHSPVQDSHLAIVEPASPTLHRRKSSSKNKVFSKVLGSIQTSRSIPALQPTRNGYSDGSIFRKLSMRSRPSLRSRSKSSEFPVHPSTPSLLTSSSSRATLRMDQPAESSPGRLFQCPSPQPADQTSPRPRNAARGSPPILTVDLNVITECEALNLHEERCVWVAVEARGVVKTDVREVQQNEGVGLDVILILDNSRFASPDSIETACDVALRIAQLSTEANDRLAVFCTCCRHFSDQAKTSGCLLHPLKSANAATIRREVQEIKALADRPPAAGADIGETLREAIRTLREPTDKALRPLRLDRCIVFVLSPQPLVVLDPKGDFPTISINAVCTAVVPYHGSLPRVSNVCMLPRTLALDSFLPEVVANDSALLVTQAADVLSYARVGRGFGAITNLFLDIQPRSDCAIESLLGNTSSTTLMAGQVVSALVRVRIPAVARQEEVPRGPISELEEAFESLEILLGETATEVLSVTAHYNQSCFPKNNIVTVEQLSSVRRSNPSSQWSIQLPLNPSRSSTKEKELSQRFVFLTATQDSPRRSLDALGTFYQNGRCSLPCASYIERVRHELEYQMAAMSISGSSQADRLKTVRRGDSPDLRSFLEIPEIHTLFQKQGDHSLGLRHYPSQPHFLPEARDKTTSFTATHLPTLLQAQRSVSASPLTDARRTTPRASPRNAEALGMENTTTDQSGKCTSTSDDAESSSVDEARAIWRHMRRNVSIRASSPSRGTPSWPTGYRTGGHRAERTREHRERELKRKALANKRSIGADTLRSLALGSEASGSEAGTAPWLL